MTALGIRYPLVSIVAAGVVAALPIFGVILIRSSCTADRTLEDVERDVDVKDAQLAAANPSLGAPVSRVYPGTRWYELGLRDGDVITAVDGVAVSVDLDSVLRMRKQLESDDVIRVDIIRNGQPGTLHHSLAQ